jgi:serine/threonine-protein kinase RsbW
MELRISSDSRWLRLVRTVMQEVSRQAGFAEGEQRQIALAVDEALANVIKHAYKGRPDGTVSVTCEAESGALEVILRHRGERFDPAGADQLAPDDLRAGGRGLFLMRATMDEVEFDHDGENCVVRLRKYVRTPAQ